MPRNSPQKPEDAGTILSSRKPPFQKKLTIKPSLLKGSEGAQKEEIEEDPESNDDSDFQEFIVQQILESKKIGGKKYYLVKWKGFPDGDTWEPASEVRHTQAFRNFEKEQEKENSENSLGRSANTPSKPKTPEKKENKKKDSKSLTTINDEIKSPSKKRKERGLDEKSDSPKPLELQKTKIKDSEKTIAKSTKKVPLKETPKKKRKLILEEEEEDLIEDQNSKKKKNDEKERKEIDNDRLQKTPNKRKKDTGNNSLKQKEEEDEKEEKKAGLGKSLTKKKSNRRTW